MAMRTLETLRLTIAALRQATGASQVDLATAGCGLTQDKVSRRQAGRSAWTFDEADVIAAYFGITPLELLSGPTVACEALPAGRRHARAQAAPEAGDAQAADTAPEAPPHRTPPPPARQAADDGAEASDQKLCVLCGEPATAEVEGLPQHLDPAECTTLSPQGTTPIPPAPSPAPPAQPALQAAQVTTASTGGTPQPAADGTAAPAADSAAASPPPATTATLHHPPAEPARRARSAAPTRQPQNPGGDQLPVDEVHQVVVTEATKAGGDIEAATAALVKRAIPDAMALWHLTRVGSRYQVLFRPPRPDILKRRTRDGADDIWEARPKWRNTALTKAYRGPTREVTVLDMNGAYLAALKTHLPHKQLEHDTTGAFDRRRSGVYLITPPEWGHDHLPNPIGNRDTPGELWVTDATLRMLLRLAGPKYELCEPPEIHESWTAAGSESLLEKFRKTLATVRAEAVANDDLMTLEYVKAMYAKFVSTCGESSHNRDIERPDWTHIIRSQAFANLWWKAHRAHEAGLTVVQMAGTDELHVTGGDWRSVFAEGRDLAEVKIKDTYTIGADNGGAG